MRSGACLAFFALVALGAACATSDDTTDGDAPAGESAQVVARTASACVINTLMGGARTFIHFARPTAPCLATAAGFQAGSLSAPNVAKDFNIVAELLRLIKAVPASGIIKGHLYEIDMDAIASALLDAQTRGVAVWISTDPGVGESTDTSRTRYLDKLHHIVYCSAANGRACIGTSTNASAASHVKLFTFSQGTSATGVTSPTGAHYDHITWFGSGNQSYASGSNMFNNSVTIYGWKTMYDNLDKYLDDMYAQVQDRQYYDPAIPRGYYNHAPATFFASPSPDQDLVLAELDQLTPDANCKVRVMQAFINDSRLAVVQKIVALKQAGCTVTIAADLVQPAALAALKAAGIPVRSQKIHDKVFLIYGKYAGIYKYRVYTGSHNLGSTANDTNEELFVRLAEEPAGDASLRPVYNGYYDHFYDAYDSGHAL
ncbi:MAG TPA: hypothetical protein VGC42_30335 [Kofleriaceae bacterium]